MQTLTRFFPRRGAACLPAVDCCASSRQPVRIFCRLRSALCLLCALSVSVLFFSPSSRSQSRILRIAAASDLQFAMPVLAQQFEKQSGLRVSVSYGSSGNFFSQIQNGAPFDLFFSADIDYPRKLDAAGLCESGTLYEYAVGKLVLWAPKESPLNVGRQGWKVLTDPRTQKIAIANPAHAPYGRAAVAALKSAGIYDRIQSKLVYGENISQTAQFVQSGNAQAGILALSLALSPAMRDGQSFEIPSNLYPPLVQGAVVLKSSTEKAGAIAFLDFVRSAAGREILEEYGFQKAPHD